MQFGNLRIKTFQSQKSHLIPHPFPPKKTLPQMTHANVGSLLVFDPSKVKVHERNAPSHNKDAVVGIITERGKENPKSLIQLFTI